MEVNDKWVPWLLISVIVNSQCSVLKVVYCEAWRPSQYLVKLLEIVVLLSQHNGCCLASPMLLWSVFHGIGYFPGVVVGPGESADAGDSSPRPSRWDPHHRASYLTCSIQQNKHAGTTATLTQGASAAWTGQVPQALVQSSMGKSIPTRCH